MVYTLRFFPLQNSVCFIILTFGSCIIHILYTGCAKIKKYNSGAKRLKWKIIGDGRVCEDPNVTIRPTEISTGNTVFFSSRRNYLDTATTQYTGYMFRLERAIDGRLSETISAVH